MPDYQVAEEPDLVSPVDNFEGERALVVIEKIGRIEAFQLSRRAIMRANPGLGDLSRPAIQYSKNNPKKTFDGCCIVGYIKKTVTK